MKILAQWVLNALVILLSAYLLPGVVLTGFVPALLVALVLGVLNAIVRPIFVILTLPITILTLGLFLLVINSVIIYLTSVLVPGFVLAGFWQAFLFGIVLSILNFVVHRLFDRRDNK